MATINPQNQATTSPSGTVPQPPNPLNLAAAAAAAVAVSNSSNNNNHPSTQLPVPMTEQQQLQNPQATDNYPHQITGSGGPTATAPFLRDFSLVAEAAKRAQMSVMVRDLESVTL